MKRLSYIAAALAAMLTLVAARSASAQVGGCLPNVDKRVPVLLVHGFRASKRVWLDQPSPMLPAIEAIEGTQVVEPFDYEKAGHKWVTDDLIGPALADKIACMAQSSREQGGKGKVIVVAHSMGGLATRFALAESRNGHKVSDDVGLVVTIATPNTGSDFARDNLDLAMHMCLSGPPFTAGACGAIAGLDLFAPAIQALATNSPQLAALPGWPVGIPVRALAGNITSHYNLFLAKVTVPNNHDTLVPTGSALKGQVVQGVGGTREFGCDWDWPALPEWPHIEDLPCEHTALLRNPSVQQDVIDTIRQYMQT